ncbi:hypothetical protein CkaCkLH20_06371 [Colletotrichum karsti]|uniref:Uncharacterized protein n=1 Tax=Colletotrichum karsti TaxID=1095194 RepID=A0A9P6LKD3_9PEZI|nr:uncharacterized protein CkaCkLH20_06371 [Colletotrichum karsti]KAF9875925.1 hypothetical protein CkaCkLH20_06371 [Colletotrichum karsti]
MGASNSQPTKLTRGNASLVPPFNVVFTFFDKIEAIDGLWPDAQWEARLMVQAKDISKLMKEGFYVSPDNELTNCSCVILNAKCSPTMFKKNWVHLRRYILQDPKAGWTAHLFIGAQEISALAGFRLRDLTTDRIARGAAWNSEGLLVYNYNAYKIEDSFNTAHEDLALAGLWPWPKFEGSCSERSTRKVASYKGSVDVETEELPVYTPATTDASDSDSQEDDTEAESIFQS